MNTPTPHPKPVAQAAESSPHTATPWRVADRCIESLTGGNVALLNLARGEAESRANAALICQAVNAHVALVAERDGLAKGNAELLAALETASHWLVALRTQHAECWHVDEKEGVFAAIKQARAAIAKATSTASRAGKGEA